MTKSEPLGNPELLDDEAGDWFQVVTRFTDPNQIDIIKGDKA